MPSTLVSEEGHWKGAVAGRRLAGRPAFWLLGVLALLPPSAMADEIPFYITNTTGISDANFLCKGPWLRVSPCGRVPETSDPVNFYNAEINLFSPFGLWECDLLREDACILLEPGVQFCVDAEPNRIDPVELTYNGRKPLVVNATPPPCTSAAASGFLGDASSTGPDRDGFQFDGQAGEKITVTLERSGASGGTGKAARVLLRDGGGRRLAGDAGVLPLKFAATLPAAGSYVVEAVEADGDSGKRFRGHFLVTVRSGAGKARGESLLLGATDQTEP